MSDSLDVIIVDDDPSVCNFIREIVERFYTWGQVYAFNDTDEVLDFCRTRETGVAILILDVFIGDKTCFTFLDKIVDKIPMAYEDTIIITGNANDDIVNMCVASEITHLIEKPIKPYSMQLAVRSIVSKYIKFAKRLLADPVFAESVAKF